MRATHKSSFKTLRAQKGAIAVELAIVSIMMLLIVAGAVGVGRVFWYADALTKATRDGARLMSSWPIASISSSGTGTAQALTRNTANASGISPQLILGNVAAECLDAAFGVTPCTDGVAPANVRIRITGFTVTIGEWFRFIGGSELLNSGDIGLAPHTTMRYLP